MTQTPVPAPVAKYRKTQAETINDLATEILAVVQEAVDNGSTSDDVAPEIGEMLGKSADAVADRVAAIFGLLEIGAVEDARLVSDDMAGESFEGMSVR